MSEPEKDDSTVEQPVEAPLSPEEIARRTAGGVARWLIGSTITFWLWIAGTLILYYRDPVISTGRAFLTFGVMIAILITKVILYFSVMLEPAIFTDRRVKLGLALSFADLCVLTLIFLFAEQGPFHFTLFTALALAMLAASIAVLVYSFRSNKRFIFLLAIAILLASNAVKGG